LRLLMMYAGIISSRDGASPSRQGIAEMPKGPFRADQVGSLLRPDALKAARARFERGEIDRAALTDAEDASVRDVVRLQEAAGLHAITDGEHRRAIWHVDFLTGFDGIVATQSNYAIAFKGSDGATAETRSMMAVNGKIRRSQPVMGEHFKFLQATTKRTAKVCMPSPTYLHLRGAGHAIDRTVYPDLDEFWADLAVAYRAEIADLIAAGCTYLQLDDVSFCCLCDDGIRSQIKRDGEDPGRLAGFYAEVINTLIAERPPGVTITIHTCRGNHKSMWMAEGPYDAIADELFNLTDVDGYFLEYDSARAGGFSPLRFLPKGKRAVLGLISSKVAQLEKADDVKRRIDEAAKIVPLDQLCLSAQCGFASSVPGNALSEDDQQRKLELIVKIAEDVWGTAA
jgi:5-methyltetrahydropteroyltriglutamate--homocysteine methyltransferase